MTTAKKRPKGPTKKSSAKSSPAKPKGVVVQQKQKERKIPWIGIAFGVVGLALVAAMVFSSDSVIGSEFGDVSIEGDELSVFGGGADPDIGAPAPRVTGIDFDGETVQIGNVGTPQAVVFLAHWCPHCQAEVPRVQAWIDSGGGVEGVELVSVATSMNSARSNFPPSAWLERESWTAPVLRDNEDFDVLLAYGGGAFPYYAFIDADGNIARRSSGELDIATLQAFMQEIAP